jgi:hypothetical protein
MRRKPLRAARANRVFCTDEKRIRTENTVMVNPKQAVGFYARSAIRADGFSSAQNVERATIRERIRAATNGIQFRQGG